MTSADARGDGADAGSAAVHTVATAGHVDHGKSTLLRALTGMEPDRWEEERERGLTIDLGFVWTSLPTAGDALTVAFVDVPGHERFVTNMLAGAGAVRVALFVVAADDGWQAQSQEHLEILDLLEIPAAVVAVTKADVAGTERALEVAADVESRLVGTSLAGAPVVLADGVSGRGVEEIASTLGERLAATPAPADHGRARLWIDRSFTIAGAGTVVTGTLAGGDLRPDRAAALLPGGREVRIRGLHSLGEEVGHVAPGARVAVNLGGVDHGEIDRGDCLVSLSPTASGGAPDPTEAWVVTDEVEVTLRAVAGHELGHRGAWHLHVGTAGVPVHILPVLDEAVTDDGLARLELDHALPLQVGDRFVIRDAGANRTAGGGRVLEPRPGPTARGPDRRLERAAALEAVRDAGTVPEVVTALVGAAGGARPTAATAAAAGVAPGDPERLVDTGDGRLVEVGEWLVTPERLREWTAAVEAALGSDEGATDATRGRTRTALAAAARGAGCPRGLAEELPGHLVAGGRLHRTGTTYVLAEHAEAVRSARRARRQALLDRLAEDPLTPPPLAEAAEEVGVSAGDIQRLEQEGRLVRCGEVAFTTAAVTEAVERLEELAADVGGAFTASQAREAWGTSRRFAIPLLEHLDARGVTDFDGMHRTLTGGNAA